MAFRPTAPARDRLRFRGTRESQRHSGRVTVSPCFRSRFSRFLRSGAAILGAAAVFGGPIVGFSGAAVAQGETPPEPRIVTLGTHQRLPFDRDVERLAVGSDTVLTVDLINTREALVLGGCMGTTTVLVWYTDGTYESLLFRVQRDLSVLQRALRDISPGVVVEMASDRNALVVRGVVPDELRRQAVLRAADNYLAAGAPLDVAVGARDASTAATEPAEVQLSDPSREPASQVIDLLRLAELPTTLEDRILEAIRPIAGPDVQVRRLQRNPLRDDEEDVLVLEGSVPDQIALVRAMQLAAQLFLGDSNAASANRNAIQVLADEAGGLLGQRGNLGGGQGAGQGGQGGGFGGGGQGAGGFAGGGGVNVQRNEIQRNLGRATMLSMARGRILSFVEVRDRPQVRVAVQFFEIDRDRLFQFSSEIQGLVSDFDQPPLVPADVAGRIQPTPANVGAFSDSDVQAGLASLTRGFSQQIQVSGRRFALDTLLQALEARGIARRLSGPVATVLNGETAQFQVGGEIPVPQAFTPAAGANAGLGTFASVDFRAFGVGLGIRPLVGADDDVTLDLSSIVSQPDQILTTVVRDATGTDPQTTAFSTRALRTNARLQDGQSLLIGGLVSRSQQSDVSKTPILGDLPLLGWLFRSTNDTYGQSELFVLVSPSVVRPPVPGSDLWLHPGLGETLAGCLPKRPAAAESGDTSGEE